MRGDVETIKERVDIAEIISGYVKLQKAGASFKACCPFHKEKTPSFFVSPARQSFCCFGCGVKGDVFTFVEEIEGLDFYGALKLLAEKAGVEIQHNVGESKTEKDKIYTVLEEATQFFENKLKDNNPAGEYLASRGISDETVKKWRIGYAPAEWRSLFDHLQSLGYAKEIIIKAGLAKISSEASSSSAPYDVFRDRIIFPLADINSRVIAFSGRAFSKETEPKYLNSPDTVLFTKSEVLYGLDKAKDQIRRKDYAVLVEGQIDLVLSHQSGIDNTVASSGTAFTREHLERLKRFSSRMIIAFDGDSAGENASEKASLLGISLGFEVKVAGMPEGKDPADVIKDDAKKWKDILRESVPAVEFFFGKVEAKEKDSRKIGKLIEKKILPMIKLMGSAIEQSHFISMLSKHTGIKEEILWEDLKRINKADVPAGYSHESESKLVKQDEGKKNSALSQKEQIEERLAEIKLWMKELADSHGDISVLEKEEAELNDNLTGLVLRYGLNQLSVELANAERVKNNDLVKDLTAKIKKLHSEMADLEKRRKML